MGFMKQDKLCLILMILSILSGCGASLNPSAVLPSDQSTTSSQPSSISMPSSVSNTTPSEQLVSTQIVPIVQLDSKVQAELEVFKAGVQTSVYPNQKYFYLYIVDKNGLPVANIQCFLGVNWEEYLEFGSSKKNGLSTTNGLLPFYLYEISDSTIILANTDTDMEPLFLEFQISKEVLEEIGDDQALLVVWEYSSPADTVSASTDVLEVVLKDSQDSPVMNKVVYFEPVRDREKESPDMGVIIPYEPRYTNEDGLARFITKKAIGSDVAVEYNIVVLPTPAAYRENDKIIQKVQAEKDTGDVTTHFTVAIP